MAISLKEFNKGTQPTGRTASNTGLTADIVAYIKSENESKNVPTKQDVCDKFAIDKIKAGQILYTLRLSVQIIDMSVDGTLCYAVPEFVPEDVVNTRRVFWAQVKANSKAKKEANKKVDTEAKEEEIKSEDKF